MFNWLHAVLQRLLGFFFIWQGHFQWPNTLQEWSFCDLEEQVLWRRLAPVLRKHGLESWEHIHSFQLKRPGGALDNGYLRIGSIYTTTPHDFDLKIWQYPSPVFRAVRSTSGYDFVCKILVVGKDGHTGLFALRQALSGLSVFQQENHVLPLVKEIPFKHITIGVFPMASGATIGNALRVPYFQPSTCSVGDLLHMLMQGLEALVFLHHMRVGHRDAFPDNFMVEWMPTSLSNTRAPQAAQPKVWLFDFDTAIAFPPSTSYEECMCVGLPFPDLPPEKYLRPAPHPVLAGELYNALQLDLWQFTSRFPEIQCSHEKVQHLLSSLVKQQNAADALLMVQNVLDDIPPKELKISYNLLSWGGVEYV